MLTGHKSCYCWSSFSILVGAGSSPFSLKHVESQCSCKKSALQLLLLFLTDKTISDVVGFAVDDVLDYVVSLP